jgi:putative copper export protein
MDDAWTLVRFLHLLGVATWVGGLVFLGAIAVPAARADAGPDGARSVITRIGRRFAAVGGVAWLVILVTGFGLLDQRGLSISDLPDSDYGRRLLAKIGLLLALGVITVVHGAWQGPRVRRAMEAGDGAAARRWRRAGAALDAVTLVASLAALWLGVSLVA